MAPVMRGAVPTPCGPGDIGLALVPAVDVLLAEEETGGTALDCTSRSEVLGDYLAGLGDLLTCEGLPECGWALSQRWDTGEKEEEACHKRGQGGAVIGLAGAWSLEEDALRYCAGPRPGSGLGLRLEELSHWTVELVPAVADGGGWR
ncbi:hypothetical protein NDU88_009799 [Pleurodeles waltl]|uniref:Uncharacterized protein n=1 Tax=Pleurodeles waltl TaxID=8319 RepID=A0AAV7QSL7_PLEWA|nr:hypothetical protein NDU88_009799 [Pleurodeles waltl]